jgi:hypothetical protein
VVDTRRSGYPALVTKGRLLLEGFAFDFVTAGKDADTSMLSVAAVGQELGVL